MWFNQLTSEISSHVSSLRWQAAVDIKEQTVDTNDYQAQCYMLAIYRLILNLVFKPTSWDDY